MLKLLRPIWGTDSITGCSRPTLNWHVWNIYIYICVYIHCIIWSRGWKKIGKKNVCGRDEVSTNPFNPESFRIELRPQVLNWPISYGQVIYAYQPLKYHETHWRLKFFIPIERKFSLPPALSFALSLSLSSSCTRAFHFLCIFQITENESSIRIGCVCWGLIHLKTLHTLWPLTNE